MPNVFIVVFDDLVGDEVDCRQNDEWRKKESRGVGLLGCAEFH